MGSPPDQDATHYCKYIKTFNPGALLFHGFLKLIQIPHPSNVESPSPISWLKCPSQPPFHSPWQSITHHSMSLFMNKNLWPWFPMIWDWFPIFLWSYHRKKKCGRNKIAHGHLCRTKFTLVSLYLLKWLIITHDFWNTNSLEWTPFCTGAHDGIFISHDQLLDIYPCPGNNMYFITGNFAW